MQVTKDVDVIWIDDHCWHISTEYLQNGVTLHEVTKNGWVELSEFNSPEFRRDPTRILRKVNQLPAEVKFFLPPRWF